MDDGEILNRFLQYNLNVHPSALEEIKKRPDVLEAVNKILLHTASCDNKPEVITLEYLRELEQASEPLPEQVEVAPRRKAKTLAQEYEPEIRIRDEKDITRKSYSEGNLEGFLSYFRDRYERLSKILRERNHMRDSYTVEWIKNKGVGEVQIIGMVNGKRTSKKGHVILELEDYSGTIPCIILNKDKELTELSKEIVLDEVLGITGNVSKNNEIIIVKDLIFPDLPINREPKHSLDPLALAIISDIHIGSSKFLDGVFLKFIKWLRGEIGNAKQRALAEKVKYLIVGGDIVDGVGIYPGQENELTIKDIHAQYEQFSSFLNSVPEYMEIIVLPGNHDAVRQAEPQPAITEEFAPGLYEDPRIRMVGNPCYANIHGVDVLSYHGRSLDDMISTIPNLSYSQPAKAMLALIKKRHLTPIYGGKVPLAPESLDYMLIEEVPDIFHLGHVHTVGVECYRGATLINSGTFQEQTSFQRKMNMRPDPGRIPIVDLKEGKTTIMRFM